MHALIAAWNPILVVKTDGMNCGKLGIPKVLIRWTLSMLTSVLPIIAEHKSICIPLKSKSKFSNDIEGIGITTVSGIDGSCPSHDIRTAFALSQVQRFTVNHSHDLSSWVCSRASIYILHIYNREGVQCSRVARTGGSHPGGSRFESHHCTATSREAGQEWFAASCKPSLWYVADRKRGLGCDWLSGSIHSENPLSGITVSMP